jgi:prepilin-type N-terminal cleavage/methylation domain-containing protein
MKGFTLIELVIVFAIIAIVSTISSFSFSSYNQSRSVQTTVSEVEAMLQKAKSRSVSQVKPTACGTDVLRSYQVSFVLPRTYQLSVLCGNATHMLEQQQLPVNITFTSDSVSGFQFAIATATVASPGNVIITGYSQTKTIHVDETGIISLQ